MTISELPPIENCIINDSSVRCLHINDSTLVEVHDFARAFGTHCEPAYAALVRNGAPFIAVDGLAFTPAEMVRGIPGGENPSPYSGC